MTSFLSTSAVQMSSYMQIPASDASLRKWWVDVPFGDEGKSSQLDCRGVVVGALVCFILFCVAK